MIQPGLVSITFRQLSPQEIVDLVVQAGLASVEWGGDVHVPHGDVQQAQKVRKRSEAAGLAVAAYGSYYRVGHTDTGPFDAVLETAVALGAPVIRVWAGQQGSDTADDAYFERVVQESRQIADRAAAEAIAIVYEFHRNTLTDTNQAARRLLETVDRENVKSYWQPPRSATVEYNLAGLDAVMSWLVNLHVFNWHKKTGERLPLAQAEEEWLQYLEKAASGPARYALIEFVQNDDPQAFLADAEALKGWLARIEAG